MANRVGAQGQLVNWLDQPFLRRLHFAPGELVLSGEGSQPVHRPVREYFVRDAADGEGALV
ncbi:hypothetical protein ACIHEJ_02255 [Streptomyces sp. NPDC052301]|uniref:hypothetical protein n=1 Tax=Streptomyces sp. NPDC052301 TaxID=3365687 RepID=UPI0037D5812F